MSADTPISLVKDPPDVPAPRRRRVVFFTAGALAVVAAVAAALMLWEPWVDRTPFTARTYQAAGKAMFANNGDGTCESTDDRVMRLLGEDKRVLATGHPQLGVILSSKYGDVAGNCFYSMTFKGVPAGEDTYYLTTSAKRVYKDGTPVRPAPLTEAELRETAGQSKAYFLHYKEPAK